MPAFVELHACFDKCEKAPSAATDGNLFADIYLSVPVLIKTDQIVGIAPLFKGACVNLKDKQECLRVVESPSEILATLDSSPLDGALPLILALMVGALLATMAQYLAGRFGQGLGSAQFRLRKALASLGLVTRSR
jgi:hypothetical protein